MRGKLCHYGVLMEDGPDEQDSILDSVKFVSIRSRVSPALKKKKIKAAGTYSWRLTYMYCQICSLIGLDDVMPTERTETLTLPHFHWKTLKGGKTCCDM
jgi:hypothetical protein